MIKFLSVLPFVLVMGCATPGPLAPQTERRTEPPIGVTVTRELGDPLFDDVVAVTYEALVMAPGTIVVQSVAIQLEAHGPLLKTASGYCGELVQTRAWKNAMAPKPIPVCYPNASDVPVPTKIDRVTQVDARNLRRQIFYQGKVGNELRMSYREFANDLARPAFTQDLTFDLNEGSLVGAKGARIEVLSASNTSITYRVIKGFMDE